MATQEQLLTVLSKYMPEEKLYEVYDLLNADRDMSGSQGKPALEELMAGLRDAGVPTQFLSQAVGVANENYLARSAQITRDLEGLRNPAVTPNVNTGAPTVNENIATIANTNGLDIAAKYMSPEQQAQLQQGLLSVPGGGLAADDPNNPYANINWDALNAQVDNQIRSDQESAARQAEAARREREFGNDMSWLNDLFQQDPQEAIRQAQALGTSADPNVVKQQQALVDDIRGRGLTADQKSRDAQQGVVDELGSIYAQGGQTARDRLLRAQARAESENWLKGQREADMQDLAERGGLGGGAEIATLLGDRQAAAQRLSMADLQASADAEERALQALLQKGGLASSMEGEANRFQQTNDALAGQTLGGMRAASDAYQQGNADIISKVAQTNKDFLRDAYKDTIDRRYDWDKTQSAQNLDLSKFLADLDSRESMAGWGFGYDTANRDTGSANDARTGFNNNTMGAFTGQTGAVRGAGSQQVGYTGEAQAHAGQAFSGAANFVGNLLGSLYGGGGGGGGNTQTEMAGSQDKRYG